MATVRDLHPEIQACSDPLSTDPLTTDPADCPRGAPCPRRLRHAFLARRPVPLGVPLRWTRPSRRPTLGVPLFSAAGGCCVLRGERATVPREGARWLGRVRPWALRLAARFRVPEQDAEDVVQEAFAIASIHWGSFEPDPAIPEEAARRRWLGHILFNAAARHRDRLSRRTARERPLDEETHGEGRAPSPHAVVSAREVLARLQRATSAPRWRVFLASALGGVPMSEIARREGRPRGSLYQRLEAARADLASALRRDEAAAEGPMVVRRAPRRGRRRRGR